MSDDTTVRIRLTEARLNDMCYVMLKHAFFMHTPMTNPRQCDIRICMDMSAPERITSITNAILLPNERAGASHDVWYEVDPERVFDECITYIEEHWMKQEYDEGWKEESKRIWLNDMVPTLMKTPEAECAVEVEAKP